MKLSPCQFETGTITEFANGSSQNPTSGAATISLDNTSQLDQVWSLRFAAAAAGAAVIDKTVTDPTTRINIQFLFKMSADFALHVDNYVTLLNTYDNGNFEAIFMNLEKPSDFTLTLGGNVIPYTPTGLVLLPNVQYKIEVQIIRNATTGSIKIWLNNDDEAAPDFDTGDINTTTGNTDYFAAGIIFTPGALTGSFWLDNYMADIVFLGNHWLPFRFQNLTNRLYDPTDSKTIYAERLNQIKLQSEKAEGFFEAP